MPLALPENRTWWEQECPVCKVGFCTFIETKVYCSYRCKDISKQNRAYKPVVDKPCPVCGKMFTTQPTSRKYCSKKCQQTVPPTGNPIGRPTLYKKKYCKELIKHMKQGLSYETFGAAIGVCKSAIYQWEAAHEEFAEAKRLAWQEYQLFWEKMGVHGTAGKLKGFNSTSYIYNVKCRFRNSDTFGNDPDNQKNVTVKVQNIAELSEEQLNERLAIALHTLEKDGYSDGQTDN